MDNTPLVSISCITYNHATYIRQCLEGFLMQKTDFAFEVLIHDDCSTDGTTEIIKEYASKFPNIIKPLYEEENQYQQGNPVGSIVWNIPRAKGKYIAMCEGDDYWIDPFKLQKQVDIMEANPDYSLCFHNAVEFYEGISKSPRIFNNLTESHVVSLKDITDSWIVPTASMLYRRDIMENYPEWTSKIYSGDLTLQLIAFSKGKIFYINQIMSFYRKAFDNVNSISSGIGHSIPISGSFQAIPPSSPG